MFTVKELNEYMRRLYPHVSYELPDKTIQDFINSCKATDIVMLADLFADYLLSQGLCDVQL